MQSFSSTQLVRLLADWRAAAAGPQHQRLAAAIRALAVDGRLPSGVRLPAERQLAERLGLSRTTVTAAYDRLREEGFAVARRGAGTWSAFPEDYAPRAMGGVAGAGPLYDLACASPEAVPNVVEDAVGRASRRLGAHLRRAGYEVLGLPELREVIAERYAQRGVPTSAGQVVITAGAMGAISMSAQALLGPGDRALVDAPSYPNGLEALHRCGARLVSVPLVDGGWDLDLLATTYAQSRPTLGYLIADFTNPSGQLMDASERERVVELAARAGSTLVVDETLAELALDAVPTPPPVAAFDDDRVVTVGSLSKSHWGGLRIGWVRAPRPLATRIAERRGAVDLSPPVLEQLVALELLQDGEAVPARRAQVRARRDALESALVDACPDWTWRHPSGGLALWVRLHAPVATALATAAQRHGVRIVPGGRFVADGSAERYLRLPYTLPEAQLQEAVRRLALARHDVGELTPPAFVA